MNDETRKWRALPKRLVLDADEVHIWRAALDVPAAVLSQLRYTLSDDERAQADRFYFEKDRVQFAAAHGILRDILGRYCNARPADLLFRHGSHGKPALDRVPEGETAPESQVTRIMSDSMVKEPTPGSTAKKPTVDLPATCESIEFNMSHSKWMALYAVTRLGPVGIDIEQIREDFVWEEIAGRFFHPDETSYMRGLPESKRCEAFFAIWTYKEAYIKGRGKGLSIPTRSFAVRPSPVGAAKVDHFGGDAASAARWHLFAIDPAPGYAGAVAIRGSGARLLLWEWEVPGGAGEK